MGNSGVRKTVDLNPGLIGLVVKRGILQLHEKTYSNNLGLKLRNQIINYIADGRQLMHRSP